MTRTDCPLFFVRGGASGLVPLAMIMLAASAMMDGLNVARRAEIVRAVD